jgi:nicotinic acid mononucleotide adenylyltransferase
MARPLIYFGSSFNPITGAHLAMLEHLIREANQQDPRPIIMLAPVFKHMFSKPDLIGYEPRLAKTQKAVDELIAKLKEENIQIDEGDILVKNIDEIVFNDVRKKDPKASSGTWTVIRYLKEHADEFGIDPEQVRMALGNDTYEDLFSGLWSEELKIYEAVQHFYVFDRDMKPILEPKQIRDKVLPLMTEKLNKEVGVLNDLIKELTMDLMAEENTGSATVLSNAITDATAQILSLKKSYASRVGKLEKIMDYWENHSLAEKRIDCKDVVPDEFKMASSSQVRASFGKAMQYIPLNALIYIVKENLYQWDSPNDLPLVEDFKKKYLMPTSNTSRLSSAVSTGTPTHKQSDPSASSRL